MNTTPPRLMAPNRTLPYSASPSDTHRSRHGEVPACQRFGCWPLTPSAHTPPAATETRPVLDSDQVNELVTFALSLGFSGTVTVMPLENGLVETFSPGVHISIQRDDNAKNSSQIDTESVSEGDEVDDEPKGDPERVERDDLPPHHPRTVLADAMAHLIKTYHRRERLLDSGPIGQAAAQVVADHQLADAALALVDQLVGQDVIPEDSAKAFTGRERTELTDLQEQAFTLVGDLHEELDEYGQLATDDGGVGQDIAARAADIRTRLAEMGRFL